MNKITKIGVSALCGSLASLSLANAGEFSVTGAAIATWTEAGSKATTGSKFGLSKQATFNSSGEMDNGWTWSAFAATDDFDDSGFSITSSGMTLNLTGMGSVNLGQDSGGAVSPLDDKIPSAYEETWDGITTGLHRVDGVADGAVQIPVAGSSQRLWIYTCADGFDKPDSQYRIRAAVKKAEVPTLVMSSDMKVWEREHPWPRAFFVDEIASYIDRDHDLAKFIRQADGLPLAAVEASKTLWPNPERTVVAATDYQLTSNSTSFRVEAPVSGVVVLTETHIPGDVHVTINGRRGEVMTVNHAFRGIEIQEPGSYDIKFFYRPRLWYTSWILFGLGLTLLISIASSFRILYKHRIPV